MGEITKDEGLELDFVPFSKRNYKHLIVEVDAETDITEIKDNVKYLAEQYGVENIYKFTFRGKCNPMLDIKFEDLSGLCNLAEIVDDTVPDYDFESIYAQNKDNIIGMFIDKYIHSDIPLDEHRKKSLIYGTKALLNATEER